MWAVPLLALVGFFPQCLDTEAFFKLYEAILKAESSWLFVVEAVFSAALECGGYFGLLFGMVAVAEMFSASQQLGESLGLCTWCSSSGLQWHFFFYHC